MSDPTPYDTGKMLEPKLWFNPAKDFHLPPEEDFGKVDFENDEGCTLLTVQVKRTEGGGYALYIDDLFTDRHLKVQVGDW